MRPLGAALVVALASGLAPQTKPSAAQVQQKARGGVDIHAARRHRRDNAHTQALGKQLGTLAAGVALAGVAAAPADVLAAESTVAGPAAGRSEFSRQLAQLRETKPAPAKARSAPAAAPAPAPTKAQQIKAKKAAPTTPVRAADVSFDAPAQQKREGKVIKNAAKPKSERDAAAATATEAARVAAREKAAAAAAAQAAKAAAKAADAAQARADRAAKAAAPVAPAPAKGKASAKAPAPAPAKGKAAAPTPAKGKAAPAPAKGKAAPAAKAPAAKTAPAPAKAPAATTTKKGKAAPPAPLPEEVAREKTSEQIAETREKKKEVRALRGMAGSTKGEVKKYKAQEKALEKKLATLSKSKRQQDAKVARAKGRQAKAKKCAAQVEKVVCPRPCAPW